MKKICYMGFNEDIILELLDSKDFELCYVITQKDRLSKTMLKLLKISKIPYYIVENKNDLLKYEEMYDNVDFILSYCFGIIIPTSIVEKHKCFNIHPGDLKTNRGPYPLVRNILNNDKEAMITLHKIGKEIDTGTIIGYYKVLIENDDDNVTLLTKLNEGLANLLNELANYSDEKEYPIIENGTYYKMVNQEQILINENDNYQEINKKIRAQKSYGGALYRYKDYLVRISKIESIE